MEMSTSWKVKVVRSIFAAAVLCFLQFHGHSQDLKSIRITYSCNAINFETIINQLSKKTGANFVYSADKIETNILVSLSVKDKELHEVLNLLGNKLNLQFKIDGNYVTIKPSYQPVVKSMELIASQKITPANKPAPLPAQTITEPVPVRRFFQPIIPETSEVLTLEYLKKRLPQLQSYFDASVLKRLPLSEIQKLNTNNMHPGWFVSIGALVNDYSKGFELQAGVRPLYAVFAPSWLPTRSFHGAFGLGTSFLLNRNLSINSVYTFTKLSQTETIYKSNVWNRQRELYKITSSIFHQQFKAMLQWSPGKNINFKFGPTFNYSKATYRYELPEMRTIVLTSQDGYGVTSLPLPPPEYHPARPLVQPNPSTIDPINHFWLGWEASVSYKIIFFKKP